MSNLSTVLTATGAPLEIKEVDIPVPGAGEIVVRAAAVAINPVDYAIQLYGPAYFKWVTLPTVLGEDVAGTVEAVGAGVTRFRAGDRVAGLGRAAFQQRVVLDEHLSFAIPPALSFDHAAVLPMGVVVAMRGLFHKDYLGLQPPSPHAKPTGEPVLVWGASTSVGSNAVQLAAAAGYEVITTASPAQFDRAKALGASQVFDYASPTVTEDLLAAFRGRATPGAFCNGAAKPPTFPPIIAACAAVVQQTAGSRPFLALTMVMPPGGLPAGVEGKFIADVRDDEAFSTGILGGYLTGALAEGAYQIAPTPRVVGRGLEAIQGALDTVRAGVSATKIVVTLGDE